MNLTSFLQDKQLTIALRGEIDHHSAKDIMRVVGNKIELYLPRVCVLDFREVTVRDEGILKPGMIINLEPGILVDTGVFCIEENYVITEDGYERLSTGSRKLHQIRG